MQPRAAHATRPAVWHERLPPCAQIMHRTLFVFAAILAVASCFMQPGMALKRMRPTSLPSACTWVLRPALAQRATVCLLSLAPPSRSLPEETWPANAVCTPTGTANVPVTRAVQPSMVAEGDMALATLNSIGTALASNAGDFGGYTIPIIGARLPCSCQLRGRPSTSAHHLRAPSRRTARRGLAPLAC